MERERERGGGARERCAPFAALFLFPLSLSLFLPVRRAPLGDVAALHTPRASAKSRKDDEGLYLFGRLHFQRVSTRGEGGWRRWSERWWWRLSEGSSTRNRETLSLSLSPSHSPSARARRSRRASRRSGICSCIGFFCGKREEKKRERREEVRKKSVGSGGVEENKL